MPAKNKKRKQKWVPPKLIQHEVTLNVETSYAALGTMCEPYGMCDTWDRAICPV